MSYCHVSMSVDEQALDDAKVSIDLVGIPVLTIGAVTIWAGNVTPQVFGRRLQVLGKCMEHAALERDAVTSATAARELHARQAEREAGEAAAEAYQEGQVHRPFDDDGVIYCGWDKHEGCGELWPCSSVRTAKAAEGHQEATR